MLPVRPDVATTGVSFVPVIVTVTVRATVPPCPSSRVRVKVSTFCSPAARYSTADAATL